LGAKELEEARKAPKKGGNKKANYPSRTSPYSSRRRNATGIFTTITSYPCFSYPSIKPAKTPFSGCAKAARAKSSCEHKKTKKTGS